MLRIAILCACLCAVLVGVQGEAKTWAQTNGVWSAASNWQPAGVPSKDDDVYITGNGDFLVTLDETADIKTLTLGGTAGKQTLLIRGSMLSVSESGTVSEFGVLDVNSGSIAGGGEIIVDGLANFHGFDTKSISTSTLTIQGIMLLDIGAIQLVDGAKIKISPGGLFNVTSQNGIVNSDNTNTLIWNQGTLYATLGVDQNFESTFSSAIRNEGKLYVELGTLNMNNNGEWLGVLNVATSAHFNANSGNHTFEPTSTISGNGTLSVLNDAMVHLQGDVEIEYFEINNGDAVIVTDSVKGISFKHLSMMDGRLLGIDAMIDDLKWDGGSMSLKSVTVGSLSVNSSLPHTLTGTNLVIAGSATFTNDTQFLLYDSAAVVIYEGAKMDIETKVYFLCSINDTTSTVQVEGYLYVNYTDEIEVTCTLLVQDTGIIQVAGGSLSVQAPFELYGNLSINENARVDLSVGGPLHLGSFLVGVGTLACLGCEMVVMGNVDIGEVVFAGGSIVFQQDLASSAYLPHIHHFNQSGSSTLQLLNNAEVGLNLTIDRLDFTGGVIKSNLNGLFGIYSSLIINEEANFSGGSPALLQYLQYINNGITTFSGTQNAELSGRNMIVNAARGTWNIEGKVVFSQSDQEAGYTSQFINYGVFEVGLGSSAVFALNFYNYFGASIREQASLTFQQAAYIQQTTAEADTVIYGGELSSPTPINILTGRLIGFGKITGDVLLKGILIASTEIAGGSVPNDTPLRIVGSLIQRQPGSIGVPLVSENGTVVLGGKLIIDNTYQLWGGSLVLEPNADTLPSSVDFITYKERLGVATYDSVINANANSTYGYSVTIGDNSIQLDQVPSPSVTSISTTSGPTAGGTEVTVVGDFFTQGSVVVSFGGRPATNMKLMGPETVVVNVPPGTGKDQLVCVVVDSRGCFNSSVVLWDYLPPTLDSISSPTKPTKGGNTITIKGNNFGGDSTVANVFVGNYTCEITAITHTSIECTMPPGTGTDNTVRVVVDGQEANSTYSYDGPVISRVGTASIRTRGGDTLVVFASNIGDNVESIDITVDNHSCGNLTLTKLESASEGALTCTTPALRDGITSADVVIVVGGQKSATAKIAVSDDSPAPAPSVWKQKWWVYCVGVVILVVFFVLGYVVRKATTKSDYTTIQN